jgi:hypothetical protein
MGGFNTPSAGGITKLSQLQIDANKDWQAKEIQNLKAIVAGMTKGDMVYRGDSVLQKLALNYGTGWNFLHALDTGIGQPEWKDIQALIIYLTGAVNRWISLPMLTIPVPPSISVVVAEDHSGGGFTVMPLLTIPEPSIGEGTATTAPLAVGGGITHDDAPPTDTDETAATNNDVINDMHLLPSPGAVGDGFYFGLDNPFDWVCTLIGTPGVGTWTITWKYWNGVTWTALTMKYDEINHWRAAAGKKWSHWIRPGDWALTTILGMNLYWAKAECTAYTSMTTQPLGTRAWLGRY